MEDSKIIELYWARDEFAIVQSSEKYGAYCFAVAKNILADSEDSEECVNDTWLRAWNAMPPGKPGCLRLFFAKITRNLALKRCEKKQSTKRAGEFSAILTELEECEVARSAEQEYLEREIMTSINTFLDAISQRERCIFVRRYFYAESGAAIAQRYGEKESNVNLILFRTRKKLKEYLEKEGICI